MDLQAYLKSQGMEIQIFAKIVGVSVATISNYIHGHRTPRVDIALKIQKLTKGKVTIEDLLKKKSIS